MQTNLRGRDFISDLDFSKEELDAAIQKRDREFLNRLKQLYWADGK